MIAQRAVRPTAAEEREAYELATIRDNDTCQRCRRNCGPTARDHRKGRGVGGLTIVANLQVLGLRCHTWKTEHPKDVIEAGWTVPGWADPEEYPAARWVPTKRGTLRLAWVLYDREGGWVEITEEEAAARREGRWES